MIFSLDGSDALVCEKDNLVIAPSKELI